MRSKKRVLAWVLAASLLMGSLPGLQVQAQENVTGGTVAEVTTGGSITEEPEETKAPEQTAEAPDETKAPEQTTEAPGETKLPEETKNPASGGAITESPAPVQTTTPSSGSSISGGTVSGGTVSGAVVLAKGTLFRQGDYQYKVTKAASATSQGRIKVYKLLAASRKKTTLVIPETVVQKGYTYKVTAIAADAFVKTKKLRNLYVGDRVQAIGKRAFKNVKTLRKLTIGTDMKTIYSKAFYGCTRLRVVSFEGKALTKVGKKAFNSITYKGTVITIKSKKTAYRNLIYRSGNHNLTYIYW